MTIFDTPYRTARAEDVLPGSTIDHDGRPFRVDTVSRGLAGVRILGWPEGRETTARRAAAEYKVGEPVHVLPESQEAEAIGQMLLMALSSGSSVDTYGNRVELQAIGHRWVLQLDPEYAPTLAEDEPVAEEADPLA